MDHLTLWKIFVCLAIALYGSASYVAQGACSPRCWTLQSDTSVFNASQQFGVASEEDCKELCLNTDMCIGLDWDKGANPNTVNTCWIQTRPLKIWYRKNINHWSLSNCTDQCSSYCWNTVQIGFKVDGSIAQPNVSDENHCKLLCSNTTSCYGIDWMNNASCYLIFTENPSTSQPDARHWDIERNLPNNCPSSTSSTSKFPSNTVTTQSTTTNSLENISRSTESLDGGISLTGRSNSLTIGIIVLAVLLGICLLIIIGLAINTVRIVRQLLQLKSDIKSIELKYNSYQGLQRAETYSEDATYSDLGLVQRNPNEAAHIYEQTL